MKYGCIGDKLPKKMYAQIHEKLGSKDYALGELAPEEFGTFLKKRDFTGVNLSITFKEKALFYVDLVEPSAAKIGAVNVVVNESGRLCGYNTDRYGVERIIEKKNIEIKGKNVAVLGSGGTAKAAVYVACNMGAKEVLSVSRSKKNGQVSYSELTARGNDIDVIIDTTPVGMAPNTDVTAIDLDKFPKLSAIVDAVYDPLRTSLVLKARERGIITGLGLYILVCQAARSEEVLRGDENACKIADEVYAETVWERMNIVALGVSHTTAKLIALKSAKKLVDLNIEFIKSNGMYAEDYFEKYGEKKFGLKIRRTLEKLALTGGSVIAIDRISVLDKASIDALKRNGAVVFADDKSAPKELRKIVSENADFTVNGSATDEEIAGSIVNISKNTDIF